MFKTSDGLALTRQGDMWTDGDLEFTAGPIGPVDDNGAPLDGDLEGANEWRIYVDDDVEGGWVDCGEGPWDNHAAALQFALNEVGLDYRIIGQVSNA